MDGETSRNGVVKTLRGWLNYLVIPHVNLHIYYIYYITLWALSYKKVGALLKYNVIDTVL